MGEGKQGQVVAAHVPDVHELYTRVTAAAAAEVVGVAASPRGAQGAATRAACALAIIATCSIQAHVPRP